ncbi:fumarylacetoacetate hydrolase family protein [Vibrio sp. ZSDZ34]|jgi:2-keto-4-pentenoate hydratase/2-oxohepta-3-ene-1,7-dioic acid hydratase in catechol pathway|uniref:Fumarylacetoacetate hydrolase family protein n=1 Tax=Vibrio gelatinilyticus TaxID=2893468 RepID=A0A9X2AY33_9VIBR|nr:fumarylacetoacetate hydrolase family protein [Vibrio gelatinilyticus]MCJ2376242.1 fumarylacetoacetate hydrolase family protein [Vibrio gelatinilyticus]
MRSVLFDGKTVMPSKILCVGRNYVKHIEELGNEVPDEMVVFNKPNSSLTDQLLSFHGEPLHYEAEICFIVENGAIAGVGFGIDLTKRDLQSKLKNKGLPWERAKAFDGSVKVSRFVSTKGLDLSKLEVELFINSMRVQVGGCDQMIYKPDVITREMASYTTLEDGDIIMTGTPSGVGAIHQDDKFLGRIKHCGDCLIEVEWLAQ